MSSFPSVDLIKGIHATLAQRMLAEKAILVDALCVRVDSKSESEDHEYMSESAPMSEFQGSRKVRPLLDRKTTIVNKVYDAAIELRRDDIRRSAAGGGQFNIQRQLTKLTNGVMGFPNKRITDLIINGTGTSAGENAVYDGAAYFANSRTAIGDSGSHDNLLAGSGATVANISTDINTVFTHFASILGTDGEPFFKDLDLQVVFFYPTILDLSFRTVLGATQIGNTTNMQTNVGRLIKSSRLTADDVNDWYAFVVNPGFEPLIYQDEQALEVDVTAEGSDMWKQDRKAQVGVSQAIGAGYAYWQSAVKFVNS